MPRRIGLAGPQAGFERLPREHPRGFQIAHAVLVVNRQRLLRLSRDERRASTGLENLVPARRRFREAS